jgi:peptidoglycan-associated lipoprotein
MLNNKILVCSAIAMAAAALSACSGSDETKDTGAKPTAVQGSGGTGYTGGNYNSNAHTGADLSQHSVYFDFDKSEIKPEGASVVANFSQYLTANPTAKLRLEGNTDERGTREYNIALGERRANAVASALESRGASAQQLNQISYGKERPVALGHDESSWAQNRRVDLVQQ